MRSIIIFLGFVFSCHAGIMLLLLPYTIVALPLLPTKPSIATISSSALGSAVSNTISAKNAGATIEPFMQNDKEVFDLYGDWMAAKQSLRHPACCVVSIHGIDHQLSILQQYFCGDDAPSDLDLRMKVTCKEDCTKLYGLVMGQSSLTVKDYSSNKIMNDSRETTSNNPLHDTWHKEQLDNNHPCILALEELAKGVASLADGPLEGVVKSVHMRVVCASSYKALDPMFHSDKCPIRGYVTLTGPGTEYMDETCQPWEYAALRSFGIDGLSAVSGESKTKRLKMAKELEFIVMKGDLYDAPTPEEGTSPSIIEKVWSRSSACIHRSPPAAGTMGKKRVILSLDLADGLDDQEWYEIRRKRGWRSGMTQRKSHLVS